MNLGQLVGELRLANDSMREAGGKALEHRLAMKRKPRGANQCAIAALLADGRAASAAEICLELGLADMTSACNALDGMRRAGLVVRHGTRRKYTYSRPPQ